MKTSWLFIGPRLLAGIGQVTNRFAELVRRAGHEAEYVEFGQTPQKQHYDQGFAFVLPIEDQLRMVDQYASLCTKTAYMTICETETVNPVYGILARYKTLYVASDFCKTVFERQFPDVEWKVLRLFAYERPHKCPIEHDHGSQPPYTFYTIGNVADPRKNIQGLLDAFLACNFGSAARLVLKATCIQPVELKIPGVIVINGLLSDEALERVHESCHCYVNCSHSEGVGMGAVEAALRSKPVVITDYGGLKEYVKTPWVVTCTKGPIGFDDFLFTRDLEWGMPSSEGLVSALKDCFQKRVTFWDHTHTRELMGSVTQHLLSLSGACPDSHSSSSLP
jgi:glycosyltransferase involved in cell wall biosynthesis